MRRTKIIAPHYITPEDVMRALPNDFNGHVTFDVRRTLQVCMIYHWSYVDPKKVYQGLVPTQLQ